jgi:hypothetical protein
MESELEHMAYNQQDNPTTTTSRIKKSIIAVLRELHIVEKLNVTADDAHKAWETAKKIEKRQLRSLAAASNAYKMDVNEDE